MSRGILPSGCFKFLLPLLAWSCGGEQPGNIDYRDASETHVSIAYLKSLYDRSPLTIDREIYISGRVVSTDQHGAFYKNLVLEDQTGAIALRIDMDNYYRTYMRGMVVDVACNSLVLSYYGGGAQLGVQSGYIPFDRLHSVIAIGSGTETGPPLELALDALLPVHINRMVCFRDVQFEEFGSAWCDAGATQGSDRHLVDRDGTRLAVRTSPYVEFATWQLPVGSGYIEGIVGYFDGAYRLEVNSSTAAIMHKPRF